MATFLQNSTLDRIIELLVIKATREITFICPDISMPESLLELLCSRAEEGIKVRLIYKQQRFVSRLYQLSKQPNLSVHISKNLNARCYSNESNVVMASRTLSRSDELEDMGVLLTRTNDQAAFLAACNKIRQITRDAHPLFNNSPEELARPPSISALSSVIYAAPRKETESPSARRYYEMANEPTLAGDQQSDPEQINTEELLTTEQLAEQLSIGKSEFKKQLVSEGWLIQRDKHFYMTAKAKLHGATSRMEKQGLIFLWPHHVGIGQSGEDIRPIRARP